VNTDWEIVCLDSFRHRGKTDRIREVLDGLESPRDPRVPITAQLIRRRDNRERVTVLPHDLRVPISPQLDHELGQIDYVLSVASESHVDRSCVEPRSFIENNVALVLSLLEWLRARADGSYLGESPYTPIEKFLHVSTDEVYGPAPADHNHGEGEPHRPSNPYSASKAAQEDIVYSYWRTFGLPVGISNCWDMGTRLLTENGLRGYEEVEIGDRVWTLDENERMVLQPIQDKVQMRGPGEMVRVGDQLVTPNHRMMVRRSVGRPRRWGGIEETPAEALVGMQGRLAVPRNGQWVGRDADQIDLYVTEQGTLRQSDAPSSILPLAPPPRLVKQVETAWFARLFGWYVSEGFLNNEATCCFGAGTEKQMAEMESLLDGWGNVYRNGRSVRVTNHDLADVLRWAGEGSRGKRIPLAVKTLSSRHLESFLDAAIAGDGTRYGSGGVIYTVSEELAGDYAEVAMKCGYAVRISERETRHPRKDEMIHSYIVRLSRRADSYIEARHVAEESYDGDVWCVSVPSGRVFAERGGTIALTGQTMNIIGERQDPEKFVPLVIRAVDRGDTVQIHSGEGVPGSRFYLHARNQADALLFLLETQLFPRYGDAQRIARAYDVAPEDAFSPSETGMGRWNVVGEREVDNLEMARMIADFADHELRYELVDFHSSRPGHDLRYALDGTKMASLGWTPPVPLAESLERTVRWSLANERWLIP
jgi:dTDP-D-glucose 4,6-dehydratase